MSAIAIDSAKASVRLWRWTLIVHRWLGVLLGTLVLAWCLSGVVMMYVPYPALETGQRLAVLPELDLASVSEDITAHASTSQLAVDSIVLEGWGQLTLARATLTGGATVIIDAATGMRLSGLNHPELVAVGLQYGESLGLVDRRFIDHIETDQWTVHGRFNKHRPMLQFASGDNTQWYVSSQTGELVQLTTQSERFWNWIGSVVHWLYPTILRKDTALWAQVVIWLTIVAVFLTITGVVFGVKQFRFSRKRRPSPYLGWSKWHHYAGLLFGLFTLTWLVSGLISMNPWGALEGRSFQAERARLLGNAATFGELLNAAKSATAQLQVEAARRVLARRSAFGLQVFIINTEGLHKQVSKIPGVLSPLELAETARPMTGIQQVVSLSSGDAYYYDHHTPRYFPVHRALYADGERIYFHPVTGEILETVDSERSWYRWLFNALHTGDFHRIARLRPIWDVWMILLITGLTAISGTGVVIGVTRLIRTVNPQR